MEVIAGNRPSAEDSVWIESTSGRRRWRGAAVASVRAPLADTAVGLTSMSN
jgi:hypothetical protein